MDAVAVQPGDKNIYSVERARAPLLLTREFMLDVLLKQTEDVIVLRNILGKKITILSHPDLIKYVMIENHKNYAKGKILRRFASMMGQGLSISEGETWRRDRQTIQPMFSRKYISEIYFQSVKKCAEKSKNKWMKLTESGCVDLDLLREMYLITAEVTVRAIFGKIIDDATIEFIYENYKYIMNYLRHPRIMAFENVKKTLRHPGYVKFHALRAEIAGAIVRLLEESRTMPEVDHEGMVGLLLKAQEKDPDHFTDDVIVDHIIGMIFSGFESTALTLQFCFYRLDEEPEVLAKLRAELDEKVPSGSETYERIAELAYLRAVIWETLRLYPAFWVVTRRPLQDDVIGGIPVAKDSMVIMSQYAMSRRSSYWDEPNAFVPERHLDGGTPVAWDTGVFFPFSQGPRKCVAASFAEMEMLTVLSTLLACFDVKCLNKENNPLDPHITLRLRDPLLARISRRVH